jgi:ATP-dependent Lon protease
MADHRDPLDPPAGFGDLPEALPLLPLRDVVIFPGAVVPLLVGRERSIRALKTAADKDKLLVVTAQREADISEPGREDLYEIGTIARIHQVLRVPDGTTKILLEGLSRARISGFSDSGEHTVVEVDVLEAQPVSSSTEAEALSRQIYDLFVEYVELNRRLPDEISATVAHVDEPVRRCDTIAAYLLVRVATKQRLLAEADPLVRMGELVTVLGREVEILRVEHRIEGEVKSQVERSQKEFYLNEQMRAIRKELGYEADEDDEIEEYVKKIQTSQMSDEAREVAHKEIGRLAKMAPMSPEGAVIRTYLDILLGMPWEERSDDHLDTRRARRQLDGDHHGLEKVKERILEYLSVVKLSGHLQGSILCLVGPPGTGKTSLGRSIAEAMGRKFVRVSLGGIRDEAEIRGHRRTYIGSRPGRILEGVRRAGTCNPVFLLDEIDKLGSDFRGDPSSALLEVLDPEQNCHYSDHFLEVPFDLSEVFFIATANVLHQIPPALEDRMEIIRLPGYLEHEKVRIAQDFLLPKLRKQHGLSRIRFSVTEPAILDMVNLYTREAGVRNLERELARVCRKIARAKAERRRAPRTVQRTNLHRFLGSPKYLRSVVEEDPEVGVVTGLAWTPTGGEILEIEVMVLPGTGNLVLTGNLKDVMKESAQAALSYARRLVPEEVSQDLSKQDVHIHVPEGAVPKDGPSAGVAMATALVSVLTGRKVRRDVAMTGELTLRGKVLPIGGLPEKAVAAQRSGCRHIVIPQGNEKDYRELPRDVRRGLEWHLTSRMEEVLDLVLLPADPAAPGVKRTDRGEPGSVELPTDGFAH